MTTSAFESWLDRTALDSMKKQRIARRVEERRERVAQYVRAHPGATVRSIAEALGVSKSTISLDLRAIRDEWAERRRQAYESRLLEDFARLDTALEAIWPAVQSGKGWAVDRLIALIDCRRRLLGLDAVRHEHDVGEVLARYLERLAEEQESATPDSG